MSANIEIAPILFEAITTLTSTMLPHEPSLHFISLSNLSQRGYAPIRRDHFYLEKEAISERGYYKITPHDWQRMLIYIEDNDFGNLAFYNPYYAAKDVYEEYLPQHLDIKNFSQKYLKKSLEVLYKSAETLDAFIQPHPDTDVEIKILKNARITTENRLKYEKALTDFQVKIAARDQMLIENAKRKVTRYRFAIYARSVIDFINNPINMPRVAWWLAVKGFLKLASEYNLISSGHLPQTKHKRLNEFRRKFKLPTAHLMENSFHMLQVRQTGIYKVTYGKGSLTLKELGTRRHYKEQKRRKEIEELKLCTEKFKEDLDWDSDELESILEKEKEREVEKSDKGNLTTEYLLKQLGWNEGDLDNLL